MTFLWLKAEDSVRIRCAISNDVLAARTAKRIGVMVVIDNLKDFEIVQRFCAVRVISGDDYFVS